MNIRNLILSVAVLFIFHDASSQSQFAGWLATFNSVKTGKKTSVLSDFQLRSTPQVSQVQTLLLRAGFNYNITPKLGLLLGYAYIDNRRVVSGISGYLPEHRIWQQALYSHRAGALYMSHRFRSEQRFISRTKVADGSLKTDGYGEAFRLRYFIRNLLPFKRGTSFTKGPFAALQNEVFINTGNKANVNGKTFDQNRLYIAGGYRLSKAFDLEAGYMFQFIEGRGDASTRNHIAQLAGYIRL